MTDPIRRGEYVRYTSYAWGWPEAFREAADIAAANGQSDLLDVSPRTLRRMVQLALTFAGDPTDDD